MWASHGLLFGIELASSVQKGIASGALHREGKHHTRWNCAIFLTQFLPLGDERRIKVRRDVFVDNLTFSHCVYSTIRLGAYFTKVCLTNAMLESTPFSLLR